MYNVLAMVRAAQLAAVVVALVLVVGAGGYGIVRSLQRSELDKQVAACERHLENSSWRIRTMGGNFRDARIALQTKDDEIQDYWGRFTFGGRECPCPVFTELLRRTAVLPVEHIGCKRPT